MKTDPEANNPNAPTGVSVQPVCSAACGTIAMLRLPISIRNLKLTREILRKLYGEGLTMQENPKGWLDIRSPKPPNDPSSATGLGGKK